jgi:hypothetical protein
MAAKSVARYPMNQERIQGFMAAACSRRMYLVLGETLRGASEPGAAR